MKIELKLTVDQIFAVAKLTGQVYNLEIPTDKGKKFLLSIAFDVADIFAAKQKTLHKKASLFDQNKKPKVTLKLHEASALESIISDLLHTVNDDYNKVILDKLKNELNQKLA
jgi:hypothetical protein